MITLVFIPYFYQQFATCTLMKLAYFLPDTMCKNKYNLICFSVFIKFIQSKAVEVFRQDVSINFNLHLIALNKAHDELRSVSTQANNNVGALREHMY